MLSDYLASPRTFPTHQIKTALTRYAFLVFLLPLALACGGADSESSQSTAGDVSGIDSPSINRTGTDCLAGTWEMDVEASYNIDAVNAMMDDGGAEMALEMGGSEGRGLMTLGRDGSAEYKMENLAVAINADSRIGAMTVTNTMNGSSTGNYSVDADTIRFANGTGNMSTSTSVTVNGRVVSSTASDFDSVFETSNDNLMTFECAGDVLQIGVQPSPEGDELVFGNLRFARTG